jgi:hypothetical protein
MQLTSQRLFADIDADHNGSLDFREFWHFLKLIQREQHVLAHASKHRLTVLPASVRLSNQEKYSLAYIEAHTHTYNHTHTHARTCA